jgi:mRNA interferase RelE/StbE
VGARKDSEVYDEMRRRVAALPEGPQTKTFEEVLTMLEASLTKKRRPAASSPTDDALAPTWLVDDLVNLAGYARSDVEVLTERQAMAAWVAYRSR